jgi:hypothetical protein
MVSHSPTQSQSFTLIFLDLLTWLCVIVISPHHDGHDSSNEAQPRQSPSDVLASVGEWTLCLGFEGVTTKRQV